MNDFRDMNLVYNKLISEEKREVLRACINVNNGPNGLLSYYFPYDVYKDMIEERYHDE